MKAKHRKILQELMQLCNSVGGVLDGTATSEAKYRDRQRAHMHVYWVLFAVLSDHPDNEHANMYWERAESEIKKFKELSNKQYKDRQGN